MPDTDVKSFLECVLENYKKNMLDIKPDRKTNLALSMAKNMSLKSGKILKVEEMNALIDELFACKVPHTSPFGKPTLNIITIEEFERRFS